jgi:diguanylate cyclase (GGDEF)-like protein/PAS domain S-box-containing protein
MSKKLRILVLEDVPADAELEERELRKAGLIFTLKVVDTKEAFLKELDEFSPDVILSDYELPSFDGFEALRIAKETIPDVPFILVTGKLGEEFAIETVKKGARDYVLKNNLERLVPSVKRALQEAEEIAERDRLQRVLQESEEAYRVIAENTNDMISRHLPDSTYLYVSPACRTLFGYEPEELIGTKAFDQIHPDDVRRVIAITQETVRTGGSRMGQYRHRRKDGQYVWVETVGKVMKNRLTGEVDDIICVVRDITERKRDEESLRVSHLLIEGIINAIPVRVFWKDKNLVFLGCNAIFARDAGFSDPKEIIGKDDYQMVWRDQAELYRADDRQVIESGISKLLIEEPQTTPEGNTITLLTSKIPLRNSTGEIIGVLGTYMDITERKQVEEALRTSEAQLSNALRIAHAGHWEYDVATDTFTFNDNFYRIFRITAEEAGGYKMASAKYARKFCHPDDMYMVRKEIQAAIQTTDPEYSHYLEHRILYANGEVGYIAVRFFIAKDSQGRTVKTYGVNQDITERKKAEGRIEYLAYYDALTGLPNRNLFIDRLKQGIERAGPTSKIAAVVIADIDRFGPLNDTYGTEVGDKVLKSIAERLSNAVRKGDTVARLGNDEFGIALLDIADINDVIPVIEKIMKRISPPLNINGDEILITFSYGISVYPHDNENPMGLIRSAGLALEAAKKEGSKTYMFYTDDLNIKASEFISMEKSLYNAIKNKEFFLHYQPYWDINAQKMMGMEALIRYQSKDQEMVSPGKFIPVLEETGLIIEVGEWILRTAMRQVKEWQDRGYPVVPVSVNLSLIQFRQKDLARAIKKIMGECGYYPSLLTLEITESAFVRDIKFTNSVLNELKNIGVSVSIDDFGTGYSSLAHLKRFPIDNLKIDISFVREIVKDPDSASIVMAIINMAHTLQLKTIAEGIETEEQWKFLRLLRCDMGQGFYLSKPLPAMEVEKFFKQ